MITFPPQFSIHECLDSLLAGRALEIFDGTWQICIHTKQKSCDEFSFRINLTRLYMIWYIYTWTQNIYCSGELICQMAVRSATVKKVVAGSFSHLKTLEGTFPTLLSLGDMMDSGFTKERHSWKMFFVCRQIIESIWMDKESRARAFNIQGWQSNKFET